MTEQKINKVVLVGQLLLANKIRQNITCSVKDSTTVIFKYLHEDDGRVYRCEFPLSDVLDVFASLLRGEDNSTTNAAQIIAEVAGEIVKRIQDKLEK